MEVKDAAGSARSKSSQCVPCGVIAIGVVASLRQNKKTFIGCRPFRDDQERETRVAPGLGGYRPVPRNAQWIELPDASAVACTMKPTQAAGGNCPHDVRCVLAKPGSGLARTERVRAVSLRLYRISPSLPVGSIVVTRIRGLRRIRWTRKIPKRTRNVPRALWRLSYLEVGSGGKWRYA
jgi:hypothetical protein